MNPFRKGLVLQETMERSFEFIYTQIRGWSSLEGSGCPLFLLAGEQEKFQSTQPNLCCFSISPIWQRKNFNGLPVVPVQPLRGSDAAPRLVSEGV